MELILSKNQRRLSWRNNIDLELGVWFWNGEVYYEDNISMMNPGLEVEQSEGNKYNAHMYFLGFYYDNKLQGDFKKEDYLVENGSHYRTTDNTFQFIRQ